jgi:hypothetical protein
MSILIQPRKPLQPASGKCLWLRRPIWPCELIPDGVPGLLRIRETVYHVLPLADLPATGPVITRGYRLTKDDGTTTYDVCLEGHGSCDCPDGIYRGERPGGCKHQAALRAALRAIGVS